MNLLRWSAILIPAAVLGTLAATRLHHAPSTVGSLNVTFGPTGLDRITYNNQVLEDTTKYPADALHIWHLKTTDASGKLLTTGDYGWGENKRNRDWDPATHTATYTFSWGAIALQYVQNGSALDLHVTESNLPDSGVIADGAVIYPLTLHLLQTATAPDLADNATGPSISTIDLGAALTGSEVTAVVPDAARPLYSGFEKTAGGLAPLIASTAPDGLASFRPHLDRALKPGETDSFIVSLRFSPAGVSPATIAPDALRNWAKVFPQQLHWTDHRPIGTVYLASSPQGGDPTRAVGLSDNPRRYFTQTDHGDIDITINLPAFQARVLRQAATNVTNLQRLNAQGAITWDIEGEPFPQPTSYLCAPDQLPAIAPEMESTIADPASPFHGLKLVDAYFRIMRDAGLRVGVCVRPQHLTFHPDGTAEQVALPQAAIAAELIRKMRYAHDRWGATLFYIDSSTDAHGGTLPADIFATAARALPDSLLIPEETTLKHFASTAPFASFLFHHDLGTDPAVRAIYPDAFTAILINDAERATLNAARPQLTEAVRHGDILMVHADYWPPVNSVVSYIYKDAATAPQ